MPPSKALMSLLGDCGFNSRETVDIGGVCPKDFRSPWDRAHYNEHAEFPTRYDAGCQSIVRGSRTVELQKAPEAIESPHVTRAPLLQQSTANCIIEPRRKLLVCPLCLLSMERESLASHLDECDANVVSCPHCLEGFPQKRLEDHIVECPQNLRSCYVCKRGIPSRSLESHLMQCGRGKTMRMFHGTSLEAARSIMREGFRASVKGLLGCGVYVTKDPSKARQYGAVIVECNVHVGTVAVINKKHHPHQKCWSAHGFDCAWIPPNCGVVANGLEEHCVGDPSRVLPISMRTAE